jgi:hypothetical protein
LRFFFLPPDFVAVLDRLGLVGVDDKSLDVSDRIESLMVAFSPSRFFFWAFLCIFSLRSYCRRSFSRL